MLSFLSGKMPCVRQSNNRFIILPTLVTAIDCWTGFFRFTPFTIVLWDPLELSKIVLLKLFSDLEPKLRNESNIRNFASSLKRVLPSKAKQKLEPSFPQ